MSRIRDGLQVDGELACESLAIGSASINNAMVNASANIAASKLINRFRRGLYQAHGSAGTSERRVIHVADRAGTINGCWAAIVVAASGAATHSIQIKKNGSNILSSAIVIDSGNANYGSEDAAGFTSSSYVAGDVFEVDITATAGGGTLGQGLAVEVEFDENPS